MPESILYEQESSVVSGFCAAFYFNRYHISPSSCIRFILTEVPIYLVALYASLTQVKPPTYKDRRA
jgi:hypothetical protein